MLSFFQSLRFKLVAMFIAIFGLIMAVLGTAGLIAREQYLRSYFDDELTNRARRMAVQLVQAEEAISPEALSAVIERESRSIHFRDFYVQVRDAQGRVVERSRNLGVYRLPFSPDEVPRRSGAGHLETVTGPAVERLAGRGEAMRLVTLRVQTPQTPPFFLQVATSLTHVDESIEFLRLLFVIVMPVGLLTAGVASWFVVGSAIRRINRVSELAHDLTPEGLADHRLDPPVAHDEVGQMVRELNEMLDRLEAGFRAQERFIHEVSHELKTPISVLLSQAQVLRLDRASREDYRWFAQSVEEEMRRLGKLMESLLTLTRTDGRNAVADGQVASVNEVVLAAAQQCEALARHRGVRLAVHLPEASERERDGELRFRGDPELVSVMVSNLIRNAIRFSPTDRPVQVSARRAGDEAAIAVRDHGPGLSAEQLARLRERFARPAHDPGPRGPGLGLTIAKSVVDLHQGRLTVENPPDGGCRFTAYLPVVGEGVGVSGFY